MPRILNRVFFVTVSVAAMMSMEGNSLGQASYRHDQASGFYRVRMGDFEITALYDGAGVFDAHWLHGGDQATVQSNIEESQRIPHILDATISAFLVNTGKHLILVDAGTGGWYGGPSFGRLVTNLRRAGYTPGQIDLVLLTHLHADHAGGLTTASGNRVFQKATIYVAKADSDFWLSPEVAAKAKAPKEVQEFFHAAQAIAAPYQKTGQWHPFEGSIEIAEGVTSRPLPGHTPGHTGYQFTSQGRELLIWGDVMHVQGVQLTHPEITVVFDLDGQAASTTRRQLMPSLSARDILVAGSHMSFPAIGRLRQVGESYVWQPVVYTDEWISR
jgi:glyoxylase-like metal-dependent hydrolase (beta-lactamase superfamily II)